jgi:hypothetical protein
MRITVIEFPGSLARYLAEILQTWGVRQTRLAPLDQAGLADDVLIVPAGLPESSGQAVVQHVDAGGAAIVLEPAGAIARSLGIVVGPRRTQPLRLRVSGMQASGLAGEALPVVGGAPWIEGLAFDDPRALAGLYDPMRIDGVNGECPGIIEATLGRGRMLALTFDLARSVLLLRQGDPANAERRLHHEGKHSATPKPSDLAVDIGPRDCGWMPYADMQARLLVDLIQRIAPSPLPLVGHLPGEQPAITLFSGDEDNAPVAAVDEELNWLTQRGASMSLYIIPEQTQSSGHDADRYQRHHAIGPHPNLQALREAPVAARVAEYQRQIEVYECRFGKPRTVSNHVATWAGYLDLVHVQARCGIRMDLNYFSGHYFRERNHAPYSPFGAAMPMRFCEPDGRIIDVLQQHRHLHDDILFAPFGHRYSYGYQAAGFAPYLARVLDDCCHRYHTPLVVNLHPGNWIRFSAPFGKMIVEQSQARGLGVWSFERWLDFREAAEQCRIDSSAWDGQTLTLALATTSTRTDLRLWLPETFGSRQVTTLTMNGSPVRAVRALRYDRPVLLLPFESGVLQARYEA